MSSSPFNKQDLGSLSMILKEPNSMNLLKSLTMRSTSIWRSNRKCRSRRKKKAKTRKASSASETTKKT